MEEIEYKELELDPIEIEKTIDLLKKCFPKSNKFTTEYLKWLYIDNPNGKAVGYNAYVDGKLVGHYSCIPMKAFVKGTSDSGLLSLNTATDPLYQGKGLFKKLATRTYNLAKLKEYKFVCGVANSRSSLLFIKLLKFQHVSPLEVKLTFGNILRPDFLSKVRSITEFSTQWDQDTVNWRVANPINKARYSVDSNLAVRIIADTEYPFIVNDGYALVDEIFNFEITSGKLYFKDCLKLKMSLCLYPSSIVNNRSLFLELPDKLKPSPLNFIFKDLTERGVSLSPGKVFFNYLDFDAY